MTTIIHHLSNILTLTSSQYINTGNRVLDNSIIALITFIMIQTIHFIMDDWKRLYNCIIFHLYNMKQHPLDMVGVPFIHTEEFENSKSFLDRVRHTHLGFLLRKHNISLFKNDQNINHMLYAISNIMIKNKKQCGITDKQTGLYIVSEICHKKYNHPYTLPYSEENPALRLPEGIYLLAIDIHGNPIYYSTDDFDLLYYNIASYDYASHYIIPILIDEYKNVQSKFLDLKSKNGIYVPKKITNNMDSGMNNISLVKEGTISSKKTFNTLFYTQKEELLSILNKFRSGNMYPSHVPMDNKLGIILYGPPGTGKTGTISAIANYLGRNLTIIKFSELSSTDDFDEILDSSRYNETIFVFDEFDYLLDALGSNKDKDSYEKTDWGSLLMVAEGGERKDILNTIKQTTQQSKKMINVSYLLQKLDGLESADGRMIIATTNNPDQINPALMRPGRFDIKLCLGNCTQDMYGKILENYYKGEKDVYNRVLNAKILTYKYSPLELINMAMQSETLDILLEKIFCQSEN